MICTEKTKLVVGIDEVGYGAWAGPVVIGAAIMSQQDRDIARKLGAKDSKKLTETKREEIYKQLWASTDTTVFLEFIASLEIDKGVSFTMRQRTGFLLEKINQYLSQKEVAIEEAHVVLDGGLDDSKSEWPSIVIPKADSSEVAVSIASIIAKVERDRHMDWLSMRYPEYGWSTNKGYGTKEHLKALKTYGATPEHRVSYRPVRLLA